MSEILNIPVSVLELALITSDSDIRRTIQKTTEIAQLADELSYKRIWMAEHHNMPHVASSATVVWLTHIAENTQRIRVGSGGIMLPNHTSLVVAEQFGTLSAMFPDRIDMGLGRAPGTDPQTAQALNRNFFQDAQQFPMHVTQLLKYLSPDNSTSKVRAFPGEGAQVETWILGSSLDSAVLSARMGLPYAFASHFAPSQMLRAFEHYRTHFAPSPYLKTPKTLSCVNMIVADTDEEAEFLATSMYKMFLNIVKGTREPLSPPFENLEQFWSYEEEQYVKNMLSCSFFGSVETVRKQLSSYAQKVKMDELMITMPIFDHDAKMKSLKLSRSLFA